MSIAIEVADAVIEVFCRTYAATASLEQSCADAGIDKGDGEDLLAMPQVQERVRSILRKRIAALEVDHRYMLASLKAGIDGALVDGDYGTAFSGLRLLAGVIGPLPTLNTVGREEQQKRGSLEALMSRTPEDERD